jgi:hypothetical protein
MMSKLIELQNQLDQIDREQAVLRDNVMPSRRRPSVAKGRFLIVYGVVSGGALIVFGASLSKPWIFPLLGIFIIAVCLAGGLTAIHKSKQLNVARRDCESRRRQLMEAIELEKRRQ